jgi:hypothetical protein
MRWLSLVLVFAGCGAEDLPVEPEPTPVVETGDSQVDASAARGAPADVLYAAEHGWFTNRTFGYYEVIRDDGPFDQLQSDLQVSLPPVDFSVEMVIAVWEARDTCDFAINTAKAYSVGDGYHLEIDFDDLGGGCADPCEAPGGALVVIKFPYVDAEPTVCRRTWDACA